MSTKSSGKPWITENVQDQFRNLSGALLEALLTAIQAIPNTVINFHSENPLAFRERVRVRGFKREICARNRYNVNALNEETGILYVWWPPSCSRL